MENLKNAHQMFSKMFKEQDKAVMVKYIAYFIIVILIINIHDRCHIIIVFICHWLLIVDGAD